MCGSIFYETDVNSRLFQKLWHNYKKNATKNEKKDIAQKRYFFTKFQKTGDRNTCVLSHSFLNQTVGQGNLSFLKDIYVVGNSVCRFKSLSYYRHLAASPSFGRADSWGLACRRRQLAALQTMEMPLDGDKYDWLLNLQTLVRNKIIRKGLFAQNSS